MHCRRFKLFLTSLLQKRLIEIEKRKKQKELKEKEKEERRKQLAALMEEDGGKELLEEEEEEENEEPLPEIFIPPTPCHILCGFYSGPGKFWVSLVSNNVIFISALIQYSGQSLFSSTFLTFSLLL